MEDGEYRLPAMSHAWQDFGGSVQEADGGQRVNLSVETSEAGELPGVQS